MTIIFQALAIVLILIAAFITAAHFAPFFYCDMLSGKINYLGLTADVLTTMIAIMSLWTLVTVKRYRSKRQEDQSRTEMLTALNAQLETLKLTASQGNTLSEDFFKRVISNLEDIKPFCDSLTPSLFSSKYYNIYKEIKNKKYDEIDIEQFSIKVSLIVGAINHE